MFSLVPIGIHTLDLLDQGELDSVWDIFSSGELNFIAAALTWASVGDFVMKKKNGLTTAQLLIVGFAGVLLLVDGYLWAFVKHGHLPTHPAVVGYLCIGPLVWALATVVGILLVDPEEGRR
ncbi:hypothetical protein [Mycobacterium sp. SMC-14]|uniref:hypothetical protein n=1 Tax=Mycobacterium sp. SMC-14 TaxID=3385968 RepID=UPI00390C8C04